MPCLGISRRQSMLVYQWYNLRVQGSKKLEGKNEYLPRMQGADVFTLIFCGEARFVDFDDLSL